jgi:Protein of unknown function (DUF2851)
VTESGEGRPAGGDRALGEAFVVRLWQAQRFAREALRTVGGDAVQVVYPGRRRAERGPDFQGALLTFRGTDLHHGGVEMHLRSSDWARHGHDRDPAYDATLLHVVLWHDARRPIRRADGSEVPTLALGAYLTEPLDVVAASLPADPVEWPLAERGPCAPEADAVAARLETAGVARYTAHLLAYAQSLQARGVADLLCGGLIEAMGYGTNREPARALAAAVPYDLLAAARRQPEGARLIAITALLLGMAGLLPSQRGRMTGDSEASALELAWREWALLVPAGPQPAWRFFGVRPASYPTRRLAGLGALLARVDPATLLAAAARALRTQPPRAAARSLASALRVEADDGYWRDHYDFGATSNRPLPAPIGQERAAVIVVNVLLPLLAAWGEVLDDEELSASALACYLQHPATGDNERLRHMRRQILGSPQRGIASTACRQQGLLHIYAQTCDWRKCADCVVGPGAPRPAAAAGAPLAR